jgi:hypothetical protein
MKIKPITITILSFLLVIVTGCFNLEEKSENDKIFQTANRDNLVGKWQTYESKYGYGKKMCEGKPCGNAGYMEIFLIDNKLSGKNFLAISSELKPPNNVKWAELLIELENDIIIISFVSSAGCRNVYRVTEIEDGKLFGSYESKNCKFNEKLFDFEGDFSAVKLIDENK